MSDKESDKPVNPQRPLSWTDDSGNTYNYFRRPMFKAAIVILTMEGCERLAYYGFNPIMTDYMVEHAGYKSSDADAYVNYFGTIAYFTPLISSIVSDVWLGPFMTTVVFSLIYTAGIVLLAISATFDNSTWMIDLSYLVLIAIGTGGIKSTVNVIGAQQFHPVEHKDDITQYYTYFYACINIGGLAGGIGIPFLKQYVSFFCAFIVPAGVFVVGLIFLFFGAHRLIKAKPQGSIVVEVGKVLGAAVWNFSFSKIKCSNGGKYDDERVDDTIQLLTLMPVFLTTIPFFIAYNQMSTTFITQGEKMDTGGAPQQLLQNVDPIGVLIVSFLVDKFLYNYLEKRNMMLSIPLRFFIGSMCAVASLFCAYGIELSIGYADELSSLNVWAQIPQYFLIAAGEIFLVASSYEVAFTEAPASMKVVSSAINLLFIAFANLFSSVMFSGLEDWLPTFNPDQSKNSRESWDMRLGKSHYDWFFLVCAGIAFGGGLMSLCLIPYYKVIRGFQNNRKTSIKIDGSAPHCISRRDIPTLAKHANHDDEP